MNRSTRNPIASSESYAARKARGRPMVCLTLPQKLVDALRAEALISDETQSEIVARALENYLGIV